MGKRVRTPFTRVFTIEDRAGPANVPVYQGQARAMGPSWDLGDRTPIREPDPDRYGAFIIVDAIKGERGLPTMSIEARYQFTISEFLRIARRGCPLDAQVHIGECQDPRDFNGGWDKILVLENADISTWSAGELGALEQGEDAVVNETIDLNAFDLYELKQIFFSELAAAEVTGEVIAVVICDSVQCGICGIPSTGCQTFFAITEQQVASPGLPSELIFSEDAGVTIGETNVASLAANEDPTGMACVGTRLVVISNDSCSLHYATLADILDGTDVWVEMATGFVCAAGAPNAIFSLGSVFTWIVGDGGYVYFSSDVTALVSVQNAGIATTEDLNDIHGYDENNVVAVGVNNAVIFTTDGENWGAVTGPSPAIELTAVWMKSALEWFVGDIQGNLFYTQDAGASWTTKAFPGSATGVIRDIQFATPTVGYMAHSIAGPAGRILRTIDGGNSWYVLPEGTTTIPANDYVGTIAVSGECPNDLYAGGLADNATDGFLVKGA